MFEVPQASQEGDAQGGYGGAHPPRVQDSSWVNEYLRWITSLMTIKELQDGVQGDWLLEVFKYICIERLSLQIN